MLRRNLFAIAMVVTTLAAAQNNADTTFVVNGKTITVTDKDGKTVVGIFSADGKALTKSAEYTFVKEQEVERIYVSSPFIPKIIEKKRRKRYNHFRSQYPFFYMGFNTAPSEQFTFNANDAMHSRDSKSWEYGFTLCSMAIPFSKAGAVGLTGALQVGQIHHHFKENFVLRNVGDYAVMEELGSELKKSYISYNLLRIPLMLEIQGRKFSLAAGSSVELRWNEHSRYIDARDHKHTLTSDINMNPVGVNLELRIGIGQLSAYLRSALTPLLNEKAPKCYPLGMGLGIRI